MPFFTMNAYIRIIVDILPGGARLRHVAKRGTEFLIVARVSTADPLPPSPITVE